MKWRVPELDRVENVAKRLPLLYSEDDDVHFIVGWVLQEIAWRRAWEAELRGQVTNG